jgi:outer membrane biosynthesis protein TonB
MKGIASTLAFGLVALTLLASADRVEAEPTPDQVSAIKSNCRSDFLSNCRGVPRGGAEAMQCLKNNFANVSSGCQQALKPLMAAAPAKAPAPAPAVAKPESAPTPAPQPAPETTAKAAPAAPESPPATAATPQAAPTPAPAPKAAAKTPEKPAAPAAPQAKTKEQAAVEKPAAAPAPAATESAPVVIGFIPPRKKLMILKNCRQDLDTHCAGVDYGDGRQLSCLFSHKSSLSADCQGALAKLTN